MTDRPIKWITGRDDNGIAHALVRRDQPVTFCGSVVIAGPFEIIQRCRTCLALTPRPKENR